MEKLITEEVQDARRAHARTHRNLTPEQAFIIQTANQAMEEIENLFWHGNKGAVFKDDVMDFCNLIVAACPEILHEQVPGIIKAIAPGSYFFTDLKKRLAYMKTADGQVQEVSAYVNRMEKTLIKIMAMNEGLNQTNEKLRRKVKRLEKVPFLVRMKRFLKQR